ncbi:hypothetical protein [Actinomadura sp. BRA 177]|uniref:hypothetical protein n=1 Tax=Actinomadura sp. BRA 177 TaxID=2745202 RepID=UPI0015958542|nr:hypothetical protein [Actinomadura sp. BRA 177]NVI88409.1 hypothetical protein [Actinomadura sp. BRA 177]
MPGDYVRDGALVAFADAGERWSDTTIVQTAGVSERILGHLLRGESSTRAA